jgi:hypothetical protein
MRKKRLSSAGESEMQDDRSFSGTLANTDLRKAMAVHLHRFASGAAGCSMEVTIERIQPPGNKARPIRAVKHRAQGK